MESDPCKGNHIPCPSGYIAWFEWAERMNKTHVQKRCPICGRFAVWEKKK